MLLALENPKKLELPTAVEPVLKAMFNGYGRVIITKAFESSLSGGCVIEVQPIRADGAPELPTVIKLASISLIQKEWQAHQNHIHRRLPASAEILAEPVLLSELSWGGLSYASMGEGGLFEVVSLADYCRRPDLTTENLRMALERLFRVMRPLWGFHRIDTEFRRQSSYDRLLPVHLLIRVRPSSSDSQTIHVSPDTLPAEPLQLGQQVRLSGFAIRKVDLINQTITLDLPEPASLLSSYMVRLTSPQLETLAAYEVNQIIAPIEGEVIETRSSRLRDEVQKASQQTFEPGAKTIKLSDEVSLPNPLVLLPEVLNQITQANVASIHGDFNLENILVELENGRVSLIDFAEARQDHILHDFLRLETEVMTRLIPELLRRHGLPLVPTLAGLYWQLHWTTFQTSLSIPLSLHPDLEKPRLMLTRLRRTAREYFCDPASLTEYYQGLMIYLLGALKFRNLNSVPEHPLPKQVAFWGAVLVGELLTHPPTDLDKPTSALATLLEKLSPQPGTVGKHGLNILSNLIGPPVAVAKPTVLPFDVLPAPAPLPSKSRVSLSRNPFFVGRQQNLMALAQALNNGNGTSSHQVTTAAATGLGGIGKTQLTIEFVHRYGRFFPGGVFWLNFAEANTVPAEIAACGSAGVMNLRPDFDECPLDEQVRLVQAAWQASLPRLLIFDNCEDPELLVKWRPTSGGCRVLLTSRRADWEALWGIQTVPLNVLPREESLTLLRKYHADVTDQTLDAIASELGDLPLALHLAGSYLARYWQTVSPANYLAQLRDPALLQHRSLYGTSISPTEHDQSLNRTFALSYDRLDPNHKIDALALAILSRAACFAPGEPIPYPLLSQTLNLAEDEPDIPLQILNAAARLIELGLMRRETDGALRLHRLVVAFIHQAAGAEVAAAQAEVELTLLAEAKRANEAWHPSSLLTWQVHLIAIVQTAINREDERAIQLSRALSEHFRQIGDYPRARVGLERIVAIQQKVFGEEHATVARSLTDLGIVSLWRGNMAEARAYFERALMIQEKLLGDHADTAITLNQLGFSLQLENHLDEARPYHERALAIRLKVFKQEHWALAESLCNLAYLDFMQGNLARARAYLERALAIQQKVWGPEHPETARVLSNLGELLQAQDHLVEAQAAFEQALAIHYKELGEEHPETARVLTNLGEVQQAQGNIADARRYYERASKIFNARYAPDHFRIRWILDHLNSLDTAD